MTEPFITTGAPTLPAANGAVPIRREVRDLQANYPEQWHLFLLGLTALQNVDENDQTSWYQIAGIHGCPYEAWNGVTSDDGAGGGYCTHSSIVFLPWHRPYLALFEQLLCEKALSIANQYPDSARSKYVSAAQQLRLPYWDWGLPSAATAAFPQAIATAKISVVSPSGQAAIDNPLLTYTFNAQENHPGSDFPDSPFNQYRSTFRYPTRGVAPTSQEARVSFVMNRQNGQIRSQIKWIFENLTDFGAFSNDKWIPGNPGSYASLEDIHDNVHVLVGGSSPQGNMSIIPYAAFDPVFWLHHCNVDRLFAIWQVVNPTSYVTPQQSPGTFTESSQSIEDENSSLTPFWKDATIFHTSDGVKSSEVLGYAYPETQSWQFNSFNEYQQSVAAELNQLYGANVSPVSPQPFVERVKSVSLQQKSHGQQIGNPGNVKILKRSEPTVGNGLSKTSDDSHTGIEVPLSNGLTTQVGVPVAEKKGNIDEKNGLDERKTVDEKIHNNKEKNSDKRDVHNKDGANENHEIGENVINRKTTNPANPREWLVNIRVQKHGLNGSFQIHIFIGDFPPEVDSWLTCDANVGTFSVLGSNQGGAGAQCDNCRSGAENNLIVTGVIHLNDALLNAVSGGLLASMEPADVEPFLTKELHWRVTQPDGSEKSRIEVPDLKISVVSATSEGLSPSAPKVFRVHHTCTDGRPGGLCEGDEI